MVMIEDRLGALGLTLPEPLVVPEGMNLPFPWISVRGNRAFVSGHGPQNSDGTLAGPMGKLGADVTVEQGYELARKTALAMLGSLKRELSDLDRIACWLRVFGMVNSAPDFNRQPSVINGFSELILDVFGPAKGRHARSAVGLAALPLGMAVEIEAEVEILP